MNHFAESSRGGFRFSSKLERRIVRKAGLAVGDFNMVEGGDHLLVAVSGGKDSLTLLEVLHLLRRRAPVQFKITAVTIHPGIASFSTQALESHFLENHYAYKIIHVPIKQILEEKLEPNTTPCALCSRIRRGALYSYAPELGCNKIALGHHLDDLVETLLLNFFFSGQLRSMSPRFISDDGRNQIIRPLCYVPEAWTAAYADERRFSVTTCSDPMCYRPDGKRQAVKQLITQLALAYPGLRGHMLHALKNVRLEHLLDLGVMPKGHPRHTR